MDCFKMKLHVSIAYKHWFPLKDHPNYILDILKWFDMWLLHLELGLHLRLPKSPKGYFEMNLNMGIAFKETKKMYIYYYLVIFPN